MPCATTSGTASRIFLPGHEGYVGGQAEDNRLFVEAVLYRYRTGCPWRDLPAPVPSLVLAAIPHCRSATWPALARPCPAAWAVGTFHTRLLAKEPQGYLLDTDPDGFDK